MYFCIYMLITEYFKDYMYTLRVCICHALYTYITCRQLIRHIPFGVNDVKMPSIYLNRLALVQLALGVLRMKTNGYLAGMAAMMVLMATAAYSAPSSLGATGILNVPTAQTTDAGSIELLLAYDRPVVSGTNVVIAPIIALEYGFRNGEVGISYYNLQDYTSVKSANAKYMLTHQSDSMPSTAVGVIYLKGDSDETDVYLVASHDLGLGDEFQATAGMLYQKPGASGTDSHFTGMMGLEWGTPGRTTLGIDYVLDDIAAGAVFGATLRQPLSKNVSWQFGIGTGSRWFVGLNMKLGGE